MRKFGKRYPFRVRLAEDWWPRPSSADLLGFAQIFGLAVIGARHGGHDEIAKLLEGGAKNLREMSTTVRAMERGSK